MNTDSIEERAKEIMAAIFSIDVAEIGADSSLDTVKQWDSLQHVNLVMALEEEFELRIKVEDALDMSTFPLVCETLTRYLTKE